MATPELEARVAAKLAEDIATAEQALADAQASLAASSTAYEAADEAERQAWKKYAPHEGRGTEYAAHLRTQWVDASDVAERAHKATLGWIDTIRRLQDRLRLLRDKGELASRVAKRVEAQERFNDLDARNGAAPARQPRRQATTPAGAEQHVATMAAHKAGYTAYIAARKAKDAALQAQHKPDYTAYKRAYAALLSARKEAQGEGK